MGDEATDRWTRAHCAHGRARRRGRGGGRRGPAGGRRVGGGNARPPPAPGARTMTLGPAAGKTVVLGRYRWHRRLQGGRGLSPTRRRRRARRPRPHRRRHPFRGRGDLLRAGLGAGTERLWTESDPIPHTHLGQRADLVLVVPGHGAFSRLLRRRASPTDLLTATVLATRAPVMVCPAMHTEMWEHPAVQDNLATLRRRRVHVVEPGEGRLAGGDVGAGRLAEPVDIVDGGAVGAGAATTRGRRPGRTARGGERRWHPGAHRPRAVHLQPVVGQAGACRGRGRRGTRRRRSSW